MDWYSRYVLPWRLSNTLEADFCVEALEEALSKGKPGIFNTDQGSQFTSAAFTGALLERGIQVSMDGKGRYLDNIFVERLWRSLKYEEVYLKAYKDGTEAKQGIGAYLGFYNRERPHQALGYRTPPGSVPRRTLRKTITRPRSGFDTRHPDNAFGSGRLSYFGPNAAQITGTTSLMILRCR